MPRYDGEDVRIRRHGRVRMTPTKQTIERVGEEAPVVGPPHSSATQPQPPAAGRVRRGALVAAIGIPTALTGLHAAVYGRWIVDDAAISFAYARSIAKGLGPVMQPGDPPVEGYSNPAWVALLALGRWLGLFDHGAGLAFPTMLHFRNCWRYFAARFYSVPITLSRIR